MHIAVINRCTTLDDGDVAFMVKACNAALAEFCAAWSLGLVTCAFYATTDSLPEGDVRVLSIVDDVAQAGVIGYHDEYAGTVSAQAQAQGARTSIVMSHEMFEMTKDPGCNQWVTLPDGKRSIALEVSDMVQADFFMVAVEIMGETRSYPISNYVLPSYFDPRGSAPFDKTGTLPGGMPAMTAGGYYIQRDDRRNITNVFASGIPEVFAQKLSNPVSRTMRRNGNRGAEGNAS